MVILLLLVHITLNFPTTLLFMSVGINTSGLISSHLEI